MLQPAGDFRLEQVAAPAGGVIDVAIDAGQDVAGRAAGGNGGQALLGVAAVSGEVGGGEALKQRAMRGVEIAESDEVIGQAAVLVAGPGVKRGDELDLVDESVLKRTQTEEQVALGRWCEAWLSAPDRAVSHRCVRRGPLQMIATQGSSRD